jgi:protein-tyrosine-phosphatase
MAAALMRRHAGEAVEVHSAGTRPGSAINALSAEAVAELGADMSGETPRAVDPALLRRVDRVIILGDEAQVEPFEDMAGTIEVWNTDEPSARGIEGMDRMRLVRDDIDRRVRELLAEITGPKAPCPIRLRPQRRALADGRRGPNRGPLGRFGTGRSAQPRRCGSDGRRRNRYHLCLSADYDP